MVGLIGFSHSFLSQPYSHGFRWGGLPIDLSVGRRLLSVGGFVDFFAPSAVIVHTPLPYLGVGYSILGGGGVGDYGKEGGGGGSTGFEQ